MEHDINIKSVDSLVDLLNGGRWNVDCIPTTKRKSKLNAD